MQQKIVTLTPPPPPPVHVSAHNLPPPTTPTIAGSVAPIVSQSPLCQQCIPGERPPTSPQPQAVQPRALSPNRTPNPCLQRRPVQPRKTHLPHDISTTLAELQCPMSPPITARRVTVAQAPASSMHRRLSRLLIFLPGRTSSRCQSPSYRQVALTNPSETAPGVPGGNSWQPVSPVLQPVY